MISYCSPAFPARPRLLPGLLLLLAGACSQPGEPLTAAKTAPSEPSGRMVAAANPLAVEVGNRVLDQGGTAMDAAVAVQMMLGFVEAPETGIGGGGFLLYHAAGADRPQVYDGRETAPAAAKPWRFSVMGLPRPLWSAVPTGQAVGVPGLVAMLAAAHEDHGTLAWPDLLAPTIELAEAGVPMPPRLREQIRQDPSLRLFADTRHYFVHQARADSPRLRNPELAESLRQLAEQGPDALYDGPLGEALVARTQARVPGAGDLTLADLRGYEAVRRDPVCAPYRDWRLCSVGPPSSGGIVVLQTLGMLERFGLATLDPENPDDQLEAIHLIAEASRLAMADRARWIGDPDQVAVPVDHLLDSDYIAARSALLDPQRAASEAPAGQLADNRHWQLKASVEPPRDGTSHFTIVDGDGNLAVLTSSNEAPFGARMMAGGFLLNNQLTDFRFVPGAADRRHPNAVAPRKRPRSSMTPLIVYDAEQEPVLALGSRGGSRITGYVTQVLIAVLDWQQPLDQAIAAPRFLHTGQALELEADTELTDHVDSLRALGHRVEVRTLTSGLHGVEKTEQGWRGGADPRLDGVARGAEPAAITHEDDD